MNLIMYSIFPLVRNLRRTPSVTQQNDMQWQNANMKFANWCQYGYLTSSEKFIYESKALVNTLSLFRACFEFRYKIVLPILRQCKSQQYSCTLCKLIMLNFKSPTKHEPKCVITHGTMGHIDGQQPPTKRKPFVAILSYNFIHKVRS